MPPGTPAHLRVRDLCLLSFLLPFAAAALQKPEPQHPHNHHIAASDNHQRQSQLAEDDLSKAANAAASPEERWHAAIDDAVQHDVHAGQRGHRDTNVNVNNNESDSKKKNARTSHINERALATVTPAGNNNPAVRAPPAQWGTASTSAGLSSRQPARSLQDWQVEDIMLLATVDGKLHARDRRTGRQRWTLETDREMVEITHNKTYNPDGSEAENPMFIIEPSQDGAIYVLTLDYGLQKLPHTVKTLTDMSPYITEGPPPLAYATEKKNTLYTVNAADGNILKTFSSEGSHVNADRCRRANPMDPLMDPLDDTECEAIGTLTLGRTEYSITITNTDTNAVVTNIKYFEWAPNNRDNDLRSRYASTMDKRYVYPRWNGQIFGWTESKDKYDYTQTFSSPVARIFDIVRPIGDPSADANLVILPQPIGPVLNGLAALDDEFDAVYVNRTERGNWYALSEKNYPSVTENAKPIHVEFKRLPDADVPGVYSLIGPADQPGGLSIDGSSPFTIDAPPDDGTSEVERSLPPSKQISGTAGHTSYLHIIGSALAAVVVACAFTAVFTVNGRQTTRGLYQRMHKKLGSLPVPNPLPVAHEIKTVHDEPHLEPTTPTFVREDEPAKETIFPLQNGTPTPKVHFAQSPEEEGSPEAGQDAVGGDEEPKEGAEPKKKKATRGRRGGKKQKEKEAAQAEARVAKKGDDQVHRPEKIITIDESESTQISGPLQINSLIIHTDKIIGQGSCGTIVFEGSFEGRDVAVKRMLSQYYELASQEVSFLQQSDDHPNVVRYFCQQKDDHFLYIAVELCQASLFEVWEADKAKTDERRLQLQSLKLAIQLDMNRTLQQLAAGLHHLHNLRIIHRDIKPQNILVAFPKKTQPAGTSRLVISDFGLGKNLPENVSTLVDPTGNAGTSGWKAPELISQPRETESNHSQRTNGSESGVGGVSGVKRAADIFSLGCLFFWVLTDGVHPFEDENGWQQLRELNIKRDKKNMEALNRWSDGYEPMQLISSMLAHDPADRPTAQAVLNHPYFWSPDKRLSFLCDCSDHFEREPRGTHEDGYAGDSVQLQMLESRTREVIGDRGDFLLKLDRAFVDTLGKQRKYSGNRLLDLLRALRNKKNHYEDMPEDVKKRVGPLAGGYLNYWSNKFPRLLMACYEVVYEARLENTDRFKGYFGLGSE